MTTLLPLHALSGVLDGHATTLPVQICCRRAIHVSATCKPRVQAYNFCRPSHYRIDSNEVLYSGGDVEDVSRKILNLGRRIALRNLAQVRAEEEPLPRMRTSFVLMEMGSFCWTSQIDQLAQFIFRSRLGIFEKWTPKSDLWYDKVKMPTAFLLLRGSADDTSNSKTITSVGIEDAEAMRSLLMLISTEQMENRMNACYLSQDRGIGKGGRRHVHLMRLLGLTEEDLPATVMRRRVDTLVFGRQSASSIQRGSILVKS